MIGSAPSIARQPSLANRRFLQETRVWFPITISHIFNECQQYTPHTSKMGQRFDSYHEDGGIDFLQQSTLTIPAVGIFIFHTIVLCSYFGSSDFL